MCICNAASETQKQEILQITIAVFLWLKVVRELYCMVPHETVSIIRIIVIKLSIVNSDAQVDRLLFNFE